jgi:hypothetical protein
MAIGLIDFDDIDQWEPDLSAVLHPLLPELIRSSIAGSAPQYVEDALDLLFNMSDRDAVIDSTVNWIRSTSIAGYHGSRLADSEIASIRVIGLIPLKAEARRYRLERVLSRHPKWPEVAGRLESTIQTHGQGSVAGRREDQVHLTLSKAGLTTGFNHYLTHGAEFDQHVANTLLGTEGTALLASDGEATVIRVAVPGPLALDAAHPYSTINEMRARGEIPNLVRDILKAWSYRLAHTGFQSRTLKIDCGMVFRSTVSTDWILSVDRFPTDSMTRSSMFNGTGALHA